MRRRIGVDGLESAPRWIVMFVGAYSLIHLFVLYLWNAAGQVFSVQATSDGTSALSVTAMAAVDLWLCLVVLRAFPAGAPLRTAWLLIALAAAARAASGVLGQLLGTDWLLNPLVWTGQRQSGWIVGIRHFALIAGGPVRLAFLAAAMLVLLRVLRGFGFHARLRAADWAISGIVVLYAVRRFGEAGAAAVAGRRIGLEEWTSLAGLPILCVLFLEAVSLRHAIARMGNGPIAKGWLALVYGVFLTGAGEAAMWAIPHYSQALPLAMFGALVRLPVAAAFALVPAFQVAAQRRALNPPGSQPENLATGVPALAR